MGIPGTNLPTPGGKKKESSSEIVCSNCGTSYQTNFIFCPNCGSNLTLPKKMDLSEISFKSEVESKYFEFYESLQEKIKSFSWLEDSLTQQKSLIDSLEVEKRRLELDIKRLKKEVKEDEEAIENLRSMSWKSFVTKITGKHADELQEIENDRVQAMQNLEASEEELMKIEKRQINANNDLKKLNDALNTRNKLQDKLKELVFKATQGITDPVEDKIEIEIGKLAEELDPYTVKKSRIQTAYSLLQMAQEYLRNATIIIAEEKEEEVIKKNALLMDILTKTEVSEIRTVVKEAASFINQAYEILIKEVGSGEDLDGDGRHTGLFEGQGIWERFMRSFMKDLKTGFRNKEQTREQLADSIGQVNRLLSWLNSLMNDMSVKIDEYMDKLRGLEQDLIKERRRIFKEQYNKRG